MKRLYDPYRTVFKSFNKKIQEIYFEKQLTWPKHKKGHLQCIQKRRGTLKRLGSVSKFMARYNK